MKMSTAYEKLKLLIDCLMIFHPKERDAAFLEYDLRAPEHEEEGEIIPEKDVYYKSYLYKLGKIQVDPHEKLYAEDEVDYDLNISLLHKKGEALALATTIYLTKGKTQLKLYLMRTTPIHRLREQPVQLMMELILSPEPDHFAKLKFDVANMPLTFSDLEAAFGEIPFFTKEQEPATFPIQH